MGINFFRLGWWDWLRRSLECNCGGVAFHGPREEAQRGIPLSVLVIPGSLFMLSLSIGSLMLWLHGKSHNPAVDAISVAIALIMALSTAVAIALVVSLLALLGHAGSFLHIYAVRAGRYSKRTVSGPKGIPQHRLGGVIERDAFAGS